MPCTDTVMGPIDDDLPLKRGNIMIKIDNTGRSMAASLLEVAELERRRDAGDTTSAFGRASSAQYCGTCRHLRHGKNPCNAGLCAGGCVKVCARCLHVDHGTHVCAECIALSGTDEAVKCSPRCHVCLHPGTRATHARGCDACPAGSGCSAAPQQTPPATVRAPAGDTDVVMTDAVPVNLNLTGAFDEAVDGADAGDGEDRGDAVNSSSEDDEDDDDYEPPLEDEEEATPSDDGLDDDEGEDFQLSSSL